MTKNTVDPQIIFCITQIIFIATVRKICSNQNFKLKKTFPGSKLAPLVLYKGLSCRFSIKIFLSCSDWIFQRVKLFCVRTFCCAPISAQVPQPISARPSTETLSETIRGKMLRAGSLKKISNLIISQERGIKRYPWYRKKADVDGPRVSLKF